MVDNETNFHQGSIESFVRFPHQQRIFLTRPMDGAISALGSSRVGVDMCGFVGMISKTDVSGEIHLALQAIQHRGQDSAGIATMSADGRQFFLRHGLGTVAQGLLQKDLDILKGPGGVGHVRYPTIGQGTLEDAQPFFYRQPGVLMQNAITTIGQEDSVSAVGHQDEALEALKDIAADPAAKLYFMDSNSAQPLPLMNIGEPARR